MQISNIKEIFAAVLPAEAIEINPHGVNQNVTEYPSREILAILHPKTVQEVKVIVEYAAENHIPLSPYSSGKNWGLGSKLPVDEAALLVDLSALKEIYIDTEMEYAIIQAGVTQEELSNYLCQHNIPLKFPVTGSAKATSVVGNMLDRGASAFFHRRTRLLGIEAVMGNGQLIKTGHWHYHQNQQPLFYAPGVGPDLTQTFCQSNFGIVTAIAIKLLPRDSGMLVFAETEEKNLPLLIDQINQLKKQQLLGEGVLITNKNDPRTAQQKQYTYSGRWSLITSFSGIQEVRTLIQQKLKETLAQHCQNISFVASDSTADTPHPYQSVLRDMYNGIPSDYSLHTMAHLHGITIDSDAEVDQNKQFPGMAVALMAVPFAGKYAMKVVRTIRRVSEALNLQTFYNFATLDDSTFEGFFRVYFDRNDREATQKAQAWNRQVHIALEKAGIFPYRINIEQMSAFTERPQDTFWQAIGQLKKAFDPQNILAKGKYCPIHPLK